MFNINDLIGLTHEEAVKLAEENGFSTRIREKDGEGFMGTCDYRMDRINFTIVGNKIAKVSKV